MLRGVDFVCGFDEEEERVIGVFGFRDEREPGFGDALEGGMSGPNVSRIFI